MALIEPFQVCIDAADIAALKMRLTQLRYAPLPPNQDFAAGMEESFLREVIAAWQVFDWRSVEARINAFDNVMIDLDGCKVHALHQRSVDAAATPLLLIHGWPGSFLEFLDMVEPLTQTGVTRFHVVCPSIPGYGFSDKPSGPGTNVRRVAELFVNAMQALGYQQFFVQGGDWGAFIAIQIARYYPQHCLGLHLNMVTAPPPQHVADPLTLVAGDELPWLEQTAELWRTGMGYYALQSTRPHTLAYALNDSPLGLAAWIGEKFVAWTDGGATTLGMPMQSLLAHLSLYWYTQTIGSSMRLYYVEAQRHGPASYVTVPTGAAIFPAEIVKTPRRWAEQVFNIVHWQRQARGGHFAALEVPDLLVADIRQFVETVAKNRQVPA